MNKPEGFRRSTCAIANTLDLIGDKWSLLVVRDLLNGKRTFGELLDSPRPFPPHAGRSPEAPRGGGHRSEHRVPGAPGSLRLLAQRKRNGPGGSSAGPDVRWDKSTSRTQVLKMATGVTGPRTLRPRRGPELARLRAPVLVGSPDPSAQLGGGMPWPARVVQHRTGQGHRVRLAIGDDRFRLLRLGDQADGNRGQAASALTR